MTFDVIEYDLDAKGASPPSAWSARNSSPRDDVILAIGQENAFPWIERDLGIEFDKWDVPMVDKMTFQSTRAGVFFGGDAAFGPKNIIWAVEHGHQAAISIHNHCQGEPVDGAPAAGREPAVRKMGMHEWSYANDYNPAERRLMPHVSLKERFKKLNIEVELGFTAEQIGAGGAALPQLRRADGVRGQAVHRVRRLHRHLPGRLPDHHARTARKPSCARGSRRRRKNLTQAVYVSARAATDRARHGQRRRPVRALRPVRRALPDRGLGHAEVHDPVAARHRRSRCNAAKLPARSA